MSVAMARRGKARKRARSRVPRRANVRRVVVERKVRRAGEIAALRDIGVTVRGEARAEVAIHEASIEIWRTVTSDDFC